MELKGIKFALMFRQNKGTATKIGRLNGTKNL
jgi:hypothetical protein